MKSKNALFLRESLLTQARKLTPLERLNAFVDHSRRMRSLMELGDRRRKQTPQPDHSDVG